MRADVTMMARKPGVAQQGAGPMVDIRCGFWRAQRLKAKADEGAKRCHRYDDPDQVLGGDDIDQQPASQRACHERCRAPQPQRSVIEAMARHASQGIGIGQRHHRRPQAAGDGVGEKYQHRLMLGAENGNPSAVAKAVTTIAPRSAWRLSARAVTNGRTVKRVTGGIAVMIPIQKASIPTAFSQP